MKKYWEQKLLQRTCIMYEVFINYIYLPSCFGQETAKGPFDLRVKLPPARLSTTYSESFALSL